MKKVIRVERPNVKCPEPSTVPNLRSMSCTDTGSVNSVCDYECENGFYNVGSKRRICTMGYVNPSRGIYYGIKAEWLPDMPPECEGNKVVSRRVASSREVPSGLQ